MLPIWGWRDSHKNGGYQNCDDLMLLQDCPYILLNKYIIDLSLLIPKRDYFRIIFVIYISTTWVVYNY